MIGNVIKIKSRETKQQFWFSSAMMLRLLWLISILFICYFNVEGSKEPDIGEIKCPSGEYILSTSWCDGSYDCQDDSDEKYCKLLPWNICPEGYIGCYEGSTCLPESARCDGFKNCGDGTDEMNCENIKRNHYRVQLRKAREWLLSQIREDGGWGKETPRAITAMRLSGSKEFGRSTQEKLMLKQLHTEIAIAMARNDTNPISIADLSLYINALTATCQSAKNFHGFDLVSILRDRVDTIHNENRNENVRQKFVPPLVYWTLCLNNVSNAVDLRSVQEVAAENSRRIDILALASLATSCMSNLPFYNVSYGKEVTNLVFRKIQEEGMPENVYDLALLFQSMKKLTSVESISDSDWSFDTAMNSILKSQDSSTGSFGGILATYYVLPILAERSFTSFESVCGTKDSAPDPTLLEVLKTNDSAKINVEFSLDYGFPVENRQALKFRVAEGASLLDIMSLAEEVNPRYRFLIDSSMSNPVVYSIGGVPNDAERGKYWIPHVRTTVPGSSQKLEPYYGDIREFKPKNNDEIVFSYQEL